MAWPRPGCRSPKMALKSEITSCTLCKSRFAATHTGHAPRPIVWFRPGAKLLIAGQAPGLRVHKSGRPFDDPSGDRLRDWLGLSTDEFYDQSRVAVVPMAFWVPGYNAKGSDLPPPTICGQTWHARVMQALKAVQLTVLVGGYAHKYHLGVKTGVTETVQNWRALAPQRFALPHPSWRNTGWIKKNPWFTDDVLPALRARVQKVMNG